jgi:branched-chain amino acid transport system substrate-binding protein
VTIGLVAPLAGNFAEIGQNMQWGAEVAADEINAKGGVLGGRKLVIQVKDEQMKPDVATQDLREFADSGNKLVAGFLSSADCLAAAPVADQLGVLMVGSTCSNNKLTGTHRLAKNFFGVTARDGEMTRATAKVVAQKYPNVTTLDIFGFDYVTGHEIADNFVRDLKGAGLKATVNQTYFVPLNNQNYQTQVSALVRGLKGSKESRGLILTTYGSGNGALLQQAMPFGIADSYAFISMTGGYYPVARTLNGQAPQVINGYDYGNALISDSAANKQFVKDFQAKTGKLPVDWSLEGFMAVQGLAAGINKAGSTDPQKVKTAMEGLTISGPLGSVLIDAKTHQFMMPVAITETVGDPSAPEGIKLLFKSLVSAVDAYVDES